MRGGEHPGAGSRKGGRQAGWPVYPKGKRKRSWRGERRPRCEAGERRQVLLSPGDGNEW